MLTQGIDRPTLRRLAEVAPGGGCVLSLYVSLDPTEFATPSARATEVRSLIDQAGRRVRAEDSGIDGDARRRLAADLERIDEWFRSRNYAVEGARGLAVFAAGDELFEILPLPWPLPTMVEIAERPVIEPLAEAAAQGSWCVALVNRRETRILRGDRDHLNEVERTSDDVHGQHDQGGWSQARYQRSVEKDVDDHLRAAADSLLQRFHRVPFDHLVLGGPREVAARMESLLHPYLRERLAGRVEIDVENTSPEQVLEAAQPVLREHEERRAADSLERLEAGVGKGNGAATGLTATLEALNERRVERLLVERGFSAPGTVCPQCGWVGPAEATSCPADGSGLDGRRNVVEEAVELALRQSADVVALDAEPPRLEEYGAIAAVLRF